MKLDIDLSPFDKTLLESAIGLIQPHISLGNEMMSLRMLVTILLTYSDKIVSGNIESANNEQRAFAKHCQSTLAKVDQDDKAVCIAVSHLFNDSEIPNIAQVIYSVVCKMLKLFKAPEAPSISLPEFIQLIQKGTYVLKPEQFLPKASEEALSLLEMLRLAEMPEPETASQKSSVCSLQ